jgi:hypothetical protein
MIISYTVIMLKFGSGSGGESDNPQNAEFNNTSASMENMTNFIF